MSTPKRGGGRTHIEGALVNLRSVTAEDSERLLDIVREPDVAAWWGDYTPERVQREFVDPEDGCAAYVIEVGAHVAGLIQFYEETDPDYRHASIDIFLHPDWHGRGMGADALRTLVRYLFTERGHHRVTIDPAVANAQAIRSYERVGFWPVGVMRNYERGLDGTWHDNLLMDLLEGELQDGEIATVTVSAATGLPVVHSSRAITPEDVRSLDDED